MPQLTAESPILFAHFEKVALKEVLEVMPESEGKKSLSALLSRTDMYDGPLALSQPQMDYITGPMLMEVGTSLKLAGSSKYQMLTLSFDCLCERIKASRGGSDGRSP